MQVCLSMYDLLMDTRRSEVKTKIIAEHALHFSKCDQIRSFLQIWSHLPKKSLIENFIFCAVMYFFFFLLTLNSFANIFILELVS